MAVSINLLSSLSLHLSLFFPPQEWSFSVTFRIESLFFPGKKGKDEGISVVKNCLLSSSKGPKVHLNLSLYCHIICVALLRCYYVASK